MPSHIESDPPVLVVAETKIAAKFDVKIIMPVIEEVKYCVWFAQSPKTGQSAADVLDYLKNKHPTTADGQVIDWRFTSEEADFPPTDKYVFTGKLGNPWKV